MRYPSDEEEPDYLSDAMLDAAISLNEVDPLFGLVRVERPKRRKPGRKPKESDDECERTLPVSDE